MSDPKNADPQDLSLHQLDAQIDAMFSPDRVAKRKADMASGCNRTKERHNDVDTFLAEINRQIYMGLSYPKALFPPEWYKLLEAREREVYGDQYDALHEHAYPCAQVNDLLIRDALKTGKWRELPRELQAEYHTQAEIETQDRTGTGEDPGAPAARVLLYGLPQETPAGGAAREICAALGITVTEVAPHQLLQPVGVLAGYEGEPAQLYFGLAPQEPVLVMAGFSSAGLDGLLAALRSKGVRIPLKAVLTETNQNWSLLALIEELQREHAAMHPGT